MQKHQEEEQIKKINQFDNKIAAAAAVCNQWWISRFLEASMSQLLNPSDLHPPSDVRSRASDPRDQMCSVLISKTCSDNENKNGNCSRENLIIFQGNTLRLFIYHRTEALRQGTWRDTECLKPRVHRQSCHGRTGTGIFPIIMLLSLSWIKILPHNFTI